MHKHLPFLLPLFSLPLILPGLVSCKPLNGADPLGENGLIYPARLSEARGFETEDDGVVLRKSVGVDVISTF